MNRGLAALALGCLLSGMLYAEQKVIRDPAEYNAYIGALNEHEPAAKAAAMEAFATQYPKSVVQIDALEQAMAAYQQAGDNTKVEETAVRILHLEPFNVRALAITAFIKRARATANGDPKLAQDAGGYARDGLAALPKWTKPEGISDADFEKLRNQVATIFYGVAGFAALQDKDFSAARDAYLQSVAIDPGNIQDNYQLAVAELQMTPLEVNGFWYAAKAIALARSQKNTVAAEYIADFARKKYIQYHGNDEGWDRLVIAAAGQSAPPKDLAPSIPVTRTVADLACHAVEENDPDSLSFSDWEIVLSLRDEGLCNLAAAEKVWDALWNKEKQGQAKLRLPIKVISASDRTIEAAVTDENQKANTVDLRIQMEEPLVKPLKPGANIDIIGVITGYTPKPFMFLMEKGELEKP